VLPAEAVEPIAEWLGALSGDLSARSAVLRQTLAGAVAGLLRRAPDVVAEATDQLTVRDQLSATTSTEFWSAAAQVNAAAADGTVMRGEVLTRWHELVGADESGRTVEARIGRLRGRFAAAAAGRPGIEIDVAAAIETELVSLILASSAAAAKGVIQAWHGIRAASTVLDDPAHTDLTRVPNALAARAAVAVRAWQQSVAGLVRTEASKARPKGRVKARVSSFGTNGIAVVAMVAVLTRSIDTADPGSQAVAGVSAIARRVLESAFDTEAVTELAGQVQEDLAGRVSRLMYDERARFDRALDRLHIPDDQVDVLRTAIAAAALVPESLPT